MLRTQHEFGVSVSELFAVLTDTAFLEARCLHCGDLRATIRREATAASPAAVTVWLRREMERDVPRFARRVVTARTIVEQADRWTESGDGFAALSAVNIRGLPIGIAVQTWLEPLSEVSCRLRFEHVVSVRLPLIGRPLAAHVEAQTREAVAQEIRFAERWLAGER